MLQLITYKLFIDTFSPCVVLRPFVVQTLSVNNIQSRAQALTSIK